jgi:formate/nitrite transporter FocA (FNT family)
MLSNGAPLEFVELLTPGKRTDTTATNGASLDGGAATTYGLAAYAFLTAFSGTNITLTLEDSANNSAFAAITGGAFTAFTGIGAQRIQTAVGGTVRRYVRVVSSGTFTSATFVVVFVRYHITQPLYA